MTWLDVVIGFTLMCVTLWLGWELVRVWAEEAEFKAESARHHPSTQPRCKCGARILRGGFPILDNTDCYLHGLELCQPEREVTW